MPLWMSYEQIIVYRRNGTKIVYMTFIEHFYQRVYLCMFCRLRSWYIQSYKSRNSCPQCSYTDARSLRFLSDTRSHLQGWIFKFMVIRYSCNILVYCLIPIYAYLLTKFAWDMWMLAWWLADISRAYVHTTWIFMQTGFLTLKCHFLQIQVGLNKLLPLVKTSKFQ